MARRSESKEIDGLTFTVQQMPGKAGGRLHFKLLRMLVPAVAKAMGSGKVGKVSLADMELSNLSDAASLLAEKLTPEEFEAFRDQLLESTLVSVDSKELPLLRVYDDVMAGRAGAGLKLLKFALEVNFGSFLEELLASALAEAGKVSPSKA